MTRKFDQVSKDRSLFEVVSAFNDLCILIKEKNSVEELNAIAGSLDKHFGSDLSVLARLLPNICLISPQSEKYAGCVGDNANRMNSQSVAYVLKRFMRVVSSKEHPVMCFLDDLQW